MQDDTTVSIIRVRFSDGGTFETTASSATEYLLDSCFVRFLFLCIVLYGILMYREDVAQLDPYNQVMLWIIMFVVTAGWLVLSVGLNLFLVRRGYVCFVFTPAIIFPMVPINIFAAALVSKYLGAEYWLAFPENVGPLAQNLVAAVCFDILHGRYVAPTHPTFVRQDRRSAATHAATADLPAVMPANTQGTSVDLVDPEPVALQSVVGDSNSPEFFVYISGERLDLREIVYLQSEDHYLKIQQINTSLLLRGKMRETVKQLDHRLGIQINRSVWVAFSSIISVDENDAGYLEVTLSDDTTFKITNSRKITFLQNYKLYGGDVSI